jgi:hypothetical protein
MVERRADIVEMRIQESGARARWPFVQHLECLIIPRQCARRRCIVCKVIHADAVQPQAPELSLMRAARQAPFIEQPIAKVHSPQLGQERRIEIDLIDALEDLSRLLVGSLRRSRGLICTMSKSSVPVAARNGTSGGLAVYPPSQ